MAAKYAHPVAAPRGGKKTAKTWQAEAAKRMLLNNLDPEVGEDPANLVVYGGTGRAARSWECVNVICETLDNLEADETLLVQSGKPVGVFRTHADAPRVLIANSNLVPNWANWDEFRRLEELGLTMFGQMTAGSWIYIGTQGILQGTYETFVAAADKHFEGSLKGKLVVTGGLGGMGGAQPLAATMAGAVCLTVEVDPWRAQRRIDHKYCDKMTESLDEALAWCDAAKAKGEALSVALVANCADGLPELLKRGVIPDLLTDQTSAHDPMYYVPNGRTFDEANALRESDPARYEQESFRTMAEHCRAMLDLQQAGAVTFDYGNNLRGHAKVAGVANAFDYPGFVPAYIRPLFCEGKGPFRWAALSGDPTDIAVTDQAVRELFPEDAHLMNWIDMAQEKVAYQGLPCRICWLGYGDRAKLGLTINELVATGAISAPIVIGRDHLDCGSVASPNRETEAMQDGSDAIADWPLLNALLNTASGASWVSIHHGGGVGMGYAIHAGQVIVADGTPEAAARLERVLTNDPGTGVMRHCDAGYDAAWDTAEAKGVKIPMPRG